MLLTLLCAWLILLEFTSNANRKFYKTPWDIARPLLLVGACEYAGLYGLPALLWIAYALLGGIASGLWMKKLCGQT